MPLVDVLSRIYVGQELDSEKTQDRTMRQQWMMLAFLVLTFVSLLTSAYAGTAKNCPYVTHNYPGQPCWADQAFSGVGN